MALPTLATGWVVGAVYHADPDGADVDRLAEAVVNIGTVTFTPKTAYHLADARTAVTHGIRHRPARLARRHPPAAHPARQHGHRHGGRREPARGRLLSYSLRRGALPSHDITVTDAHTTGSPLELFTTLPEPTLAGVPAEYTMTDAEISAALGG